MPMFLVTESTTKTYNPCLITLLRVIQFVAIVLLVILALAICVMKVPSISSPYTSRVLCFTGQNQTGETFEYREDQQKWSSTPPDKSFQSVIIKGVWLFFENPFYNFREGGRVTWAYGRDLHYNFPKDFAKKCSSLKLVGNKKSWNEDSITFYSGPYFEGLESSYTEDVSDIFNAGFYKSLIVIGSSPWTLYSDTDFKGNATCAYPDPKPSIGLDIGFHPTCDDCQTIFSARKGCYSSEMIFDHEPPLQQDIQGGYGSWSP